MWILLFPLTGTQLMPRADNHAQFSTKTPSCLLVVLKSLSLHYTFSNHEYHIQPLTGHEMGKGPIYGSKSNLIMRQVHKCTVVSELKCFCHSLRQNFKQLRCYKKKEKKPTKKNFPPNRIQAMKRYVQNSYFKFLTWKYNQINKWIGR